MKKLTFSTMAAARLRANKRQYLSLVLGIFLSIFMVSTLVLSVWGIYLDHLEDRYNKVGDLDFVILDNDIVSEETIRSLSQYEQFGYAYISGIVTDRNVYVGYYDEAGLSMMNLTPVEGRLPETAGEIAVEASAMDVLETQWQIGENVELDITPVDGEAEKRTYTLVGILPERSMYLSVSDCHDLNQFPAIVTSTDEPGFTVGRLGVHYLMDLKTYAGVDRMIHRIWENYHYLSTKFYGLSITGEQRMFEGMGAAMNADSDMFSLIKLAGVLAGALIMSCAAGIACAMEGVLVKRREEIGALRVLGATRRQIRRMFGRENLLLALIVSPLSILVSMGAVYALSLFLPDTIRFGVNLWLIMPIALFSIVVILISGYLPLVRASRQMPMSVIRDTAMLRRSKGVKPQKEFSVAKLMASRQVRFHPDRQLGASLLVGLMLLCSGLLSAVIITYADRSYSGEREAFAINNPGSIYYDGQISIINNRSMDKQALAQLENLTHVSYLRLDREMLVTTVLENAPLYAMIDDQYGMLDDEQFESAMTKIENEREFWEHSRESSRNEYLKFLEDYQIPGEAYQMIIATVDLDSENVNKLRPLLESGKINVDAINEGREVIVVAPEIWIKPHEVGYGHVVWRSEEDVRDDPNGEGAFLAAWNDSFYAGQELPIIQLYQTEENGAVNRIDTMPTVGAVLSDHANVAGSFFTATVILTTEQGLENMGLLTEGLSCVGVYLDGEVTLEEEEILERQINAIVRRYESHTVFNDLENYRVREATHRKQIFLYAAVSILFFSVSVGMIVSSVTRQLNSEGRTIGMLRAVGADEKVILGCYSGQINACVLGGLGLCGGLFLIYFLINFINCLIYKYETASLLQLMAVMYGTILVLGILCLLICKFLLRFRIREIVNKSIIDNIREL